MKDLGEDTLSGDIFVFLGRIMDKVSWTSSMFVFLFFPLCLAAISWRFNSEEFSKASPWSSRLNVSLNSGTEPFELAVFFSRFFLTFFSPVLILKIGFVQAEKSFSEEDWLFTEESSSVDSTFLGRPRDFFPFFSTSSICFLKWSNSLSLMMLFGHSGQFRSFGALFGHFWPIFALNSRWL